MHGGEIDAELTCHAPRCRRGNGRHGRGYRFGRGSAARWGGGQALDGRFLVAGADAGDHRTLRGYVTLTHEKLENLTGRGRVDLLLDLLDLDGGHERARLDAGTRLDEPGDEDTLVHLVGNVGEQDVGGHAPPCSRSAVPAARGRGEAHHGSDQRPTSWRAAVAMVSGLGRQNCSSGLL
jgi:hypothetical protein